MKRVPHKLAYLVTHPIQYQAPLLRHLAEKEELDLTVFFLSDLSLREHHDHGFGHTVDWDVPLVGGYDHVFLPTVYRTDRLNFVEPVVRGLEEHLAKGRFDALWIHGWFHQAKLRAMRIARANGTRVLLRGESLLHGPAWKQRLKSVVQRPLCGAADGFLAIGSRNREFYLRQGVAPERIFDVPYAVDNAFFRSRAEEASRTREELRAELGLEAGRPIVLYASKLVARKRPGDVLDAWEQLRLPPDRAPYLLFVGDGEERDVLELRAGRHADVRFLGFRNQTELPGFYDLSDVLVLPSSYEPWGLVVNEAMNAARPVVATECVGAAADLIEDGVTGYRVRVGDVAQLARRLEDTLRDPEHARKLGEAARSRVGEWDFERDWIGLRAALEAGVPRTAGTAA